MKDKKSERRMTHDREVFKRTEYAQWSVRMWEPDKSPHEAYGCHHRCPEYNDESRNYTEMWSWFVEDTVGSDEHPTCYGCDVKVPDYIQTIVRLYQGE